MNTFLCPHCGKDVELSEAVKHQLEETVRAETEARVRKEITEQASIELEDLKKTISEKDKKMDEMRKAEMDLREQKRNLEEREKSMELEMARRIDEQKKNLSQEIRKQADEEYRFKEMEKEKVISQLRDALDDARRKASQGSQQLQGEVLELDLEENLRASFPGDLIEPVGKGVRGADIRQVVKTPLGNICGTILWESKRTKAWSDEWATKLKEDLRAEKADVPIIVTMAFPKDMNPSMGLYDGVWVVKYDLALILAQLIRKNILDVARQKAVSAQKSDKASLLYDYVMGHEFRQQIESLIEVYKEMHDQVDKERAAFERIWKAREAQQKRLMLATVNVYGSMQGLVGGSMPQIKGIELELGEGQQ